MSASSRDPIYRPCDDEYFCEGIDDLSYLGTFESYKIKIGSDELYQETGEYEEIEDFLCAHNILVIKQKQPFVKPLLGSGDDYS